MAKGKRKEPQVQDEITVKLPNFLGIKPGIYLTIIYSFFILLIIFLILFLPGIRKNGSKVTLTSLPSEAAVYLDGVYVGYTPLEIFIPKGKREISFRKEGFSELTTIETIHGKIFASWLFPYKLNFTYSLKLASKDAYLSTLLEEYSQWSSVAPYAENYQPPIKLKEALAVLAGYGELSKEEGYQILYFLMHYMNSRNYLAQTSSATLALQGAGNPVTPLSFIQSVQLFIQLQAEYGNLPFLISLFLEEEERKLISGNALSQYRDGYRNVIDSIDRMTHQNTDNPVIVEEIIFIPLEGGEFVMGKGAFSEYHPHPVIVEPFYLADRHITNAQYSRFLAENPEWNFRNKSTLMKKDYVTEEYLNGFVPMKDLDKPVTYISYHAALAYCHWLQGKLPPSLTGYTVRLPKEEEFEWAAVTGGASERVFNQKEGPLPIRPGRSDQKGLYDLLGNLWIWCETTYSPSGYFLTSWKPSVKVEVPALAKAPERVIRGGSWANNSREVDAQTRGSQPADWCTPFTGFKPVLVRK